MSGNNPSLSTASINVTGQVYSGLMNWNGTTGDAWNTPADWSDTLNASVHAAPGLDAGFTGVDAAYFLSTSGPNTINLNNDSPNLNALTFNSTGSYTIAPGTGSSTGLTFGGSAPAITDAGANIIGVPVTLAGNLTATVTNSADSLTVTGAISGGSANSLSKAGAGTMTLSALSSYSGATNVNAGTLIVSGSLSGSGPVSVAGMLEVDGSLNNASTISVNSGGTLQGTGVVGGITSTGGTIEPGDSVGSTSAGALTANGSSISLDAASTFSIRLGVLSSTDSDQLIVPNGTVLLTDTPIAVTLGGALSGIGNNYVIINGGTNTNALTGMGTSTDEFSYNSTPLASGDSFTVTGGYQFTIFYGVNANNTGSGNDVVLELTAVPEPGTWAMLLSGAGMLVIWQRGRRRRS